MLKKYKHNNNKTFVINTVKMIILTFDAFIELAFTDEYPPIPPINDAL